VEGAKRVSLTSKCKDQWVQELVDVYHHISNETKTAKYQPYMIVENNISNIPYSERAAIALN
jgi:hypothetical protein